MTPRMPWSRFCALLTLLCVCLILTTGCQNSESQGKNWSLFGQTAQTPTTVTNNYYLNNGSTPVPRGGGGRTLPTSQPAPDALTEAPLTVGDGTGAMVAGPAGRYTQVVILRSDIGTTNSQTPTGSNTGTSTLSQTPTQTTETKAGLAASFQLQGAGQQQANPSGSGEGPATSTGAAQSQKLTPTLNASGTGNVTGGNPGGGAGGGSSPAPQ